MGGRKRERRINEGKGMKEREEREKDQEGEGRFPAENVENSKGRYSVACLDLSETHPIHFLSLL